MRVCDYPQTGFRGFHLQITEYEFVLVILHLGDSFGRSSRTVYMVSASSQDCLQGYSRRRVVIDDQNARQLGKGLTAGPGSATIARSPWTQVYGQTPEIEIENLPWWSGEHSMKHSTNVA